MDLTVPEKVADLLTEPVYCTFVTLLPDGKPHATIVWRKWEDPHLLICTNKKTRKYKNVMANPHVTIMNLDKDNPGRYLEVRGEVVAVDEDPQAEVLDRVSQFYTGKPYYGGVLPAERFKANHHVVIRVQPVKYVTHR